MLWHENRASWDTVLTFFSKGIEHVPETVGTGNRKDEAHTPEKCFKVYQEHMFCFVSQSYSWTLVSSGLTERKRRTR